MKALPIRPVPGLFGRLCAVAALIAALSLLAPATGKAQDMSDLVLRLNQMENQVRRLSGEVEELQFENRRLRQELENFEEDVEFRFDDLGAAAAPQRSSQSGRPATTTPDAPPVQQAEPPGLAQPAFDTPLRETPRRCRRRASVRMRSIPVGIRQRPACRSLWEARHPPPRWPCRARGSAPRRMVRIQRVRGRAIPCPA